ncbi:MAG: DUF362 domain-containing protein [Bacteroidales bacterium]
MDKGRRKFFRLVTAGGIGAGLSPLMAGSLAASAKTDQETATNIADVLKYPRNMNSMPGKYPGRVVKVRHNNPLSDNAIKEDAACLMLEEGMMGLTGTNDASIAWRQFVKPGEAVGLKVNPIGGKLLSTSHALVQSVISQLEQSGISRNNIVIFDRRMQHLREAGFTAENYPGIRIMATEHVDEKGSYYDENGELYSLSKIDKDWYYWADCEMEYDDYLLPFMVNQGRYSYFSKIVTQQLDKIINMPVMKNAGASITLCLKNLGYGVITNTSRLHSTLWAETSAEVCAFPPVRDKVVLNIADGIRGCYDGGPGANPQFITDYKMILLGTDPVAVDMTGYDIIIGKRIEMGRQDAYSDTGEKQMKLAGELGLGVSARDRIDLRNIELA